MNRALSSIFRRPTTTAPLFSDCLVQTAKRTIGQVRVGDRVLGAGFLIGIDRMLVPCHILDNEDVSKIQVCFQNCVSRQSYMFSCLRIYMGSREIDYAVLQLKANDQGYPGCFVPIPPMAIGEHRGPFLLTSFTGNHPTTEENEGMSCYGNSFCSDVFTVQGYCGSTLWEPAGKIFAFHEAQSTGACQTVPYQVRRALYLKPIINHLLPFFSSKSICEPLAIEQAERPLEGLPSVDPCFDLEGGRPVMNLSLKGKKGVYKAWELRSKNSRGAGNRGITIQYPNKQKIDYWFSPNPHGTKAYNKNQEPLYRAAATELATRFERGEAPPQSFTFVAYKQEFTAELA